MSETKNNATPKGTVAATYTCLDAKDYGGEKLDGFIIEPRTASDLQAVAELVDKMGDSQSEAKSVELERDCLSMLTGIEADAFLCLTHRDYAGLSLVAAPFLPPRYLSILQN